MGTLRPRGSAGKGAGSTLQVKCPAGDVPKLEGSWCLAEQRSKSALGPLGSATSRCPGARFATKFSHPTQGLERQLSGSSRRRLVKGKCPELGLWRHSGSLAGAFSGRDRAMVQSTMRRTAGRRFHGQPPGSSTRLDQPTPAADLTDTVAVCVPDDG